MLSVAILAAVFLVSIVAFAIIRALVREFTVMRMLNTPSVCMRCKHGLTQTMLASGRCPECGTPYIYGGIDSPSTRIKAYLSTNNAYVAAFMVALVIGIFVGIAFSAMFNRTHESVAFAVGAGTCVVITLFACILIKARRIRLKRAVDAMERDWTPGTKTERNT